MENIHSVSPLFRGIAVTIARHFNILISLTLSLIITSCGGDDDSFGGYDRIAGSWYGTRTYYNPAGGTKYQYLTITFDYDGTGELEYEAPTSYSFAKFTYHIVGNSVICSGASANTYGDVTDSFEMTLTIDGDRLIPTDSYTSFILTRDNSIMTDGNGNEVHDNSDLINRVWVRSDGWSVIVIDDDTYTEYILLESYGKTYSSKSSGHLSYDYINNTLNFGGTQYNIIVLSSSSLQISNSSKSFLFNAGSSSDIPSNGTNAGTQEKIKILKSPSYWTSKNPSRQFIFYDNNNVTYFEEHPKTLGSMGHPILCAKGTFTLQDDVLTCIYNNITWEGYQYSSDWFPGWKAGSTATKRYTIRYLSTESLTLVCEDGSIYYLSPH